MKNLSIAISLLLACQVANASGVYYCAKDGRKIMTDQPCDSLGANQKKYIRYDEFRPLSTMESPTERDKQQADRFYHEEQNRRRPDSGYRPQQANVEAEQNKAQCHQLEQQKQAIIAQQRMPQQGSMHDYLRRQREGVDTEIYRRKCETL